MSFFKRLFGNKPTTLNVQPFDAPLAPERAFFAIGDVHGCLDKMQLLMGKVEKINPNAPVVMVGDYVDRGEDSAGVLRALFDRRNDPNLICLTGNHEQMMLDFINNPEAKGERWLRYGGIQTLASFGVGGVSTSSKGSDLKPAAADLIDAMSVDMVKWLRDLPTLWQNGNVSVVHAGADPATPISMQGSGTLAWGHRDFETIPRQDGIWVLHGHTIVDTAYARAGRIAIDTGAYATGKLTAAYITSENVEFLSQ